MSSSVGRSICNPMEVKMISNLVRFLVFKNHVKRSSITVLAAYQGQLLLLRKEMKSINSNNDIVDVQTVDRFQGSENDIIILSCVRSNQKGEIGFLSKTNRVCVAISRARLVKKKKKLFIIL